MVSRKRKCIGTENYQNGKDAENTRYLKDLISHNLNPFSDSHVEKNDKPNDPYDHKVISKKNGRKRTIYKEIKSGNAVLSPQEKEFQKNHPRSYVIERTGKDSAVRDARNLKRFFIG